MYWFSLDKDNKKAVSYKTSLGWIAKKVHFFLRAALLGGGYCARHSPMNERISSRPVPFSDELKSMGGSSSHCSFRVRA